MIGNETGRLGEEIVKRYVKTKGFRVLRSNWQKPFGEIDIVIEKAGKTHFVEVKTVSCEMGDNGSRETSNPAENVDKYKLQKLGRVIQAYIAEFHVKNWQFDVYSVKIDKTSKKARITMLSNQILPE